MTRYSIVPVIDQMIRSGLRRLSHRLQMAVSS
jgi:hypothetical protein